jgi:hypothetical protein
VAGAGLAAVRAVEVATELLRIREILTPGRPGRMVTPILVDPRMTESDRNEQSADGLSALCDPWCSVVSDNSEPRARPATNGDPTMSAQRPGWPPFTPEAAIEMVRLAETGGTAATPRKSRSPILSTASGETALNLEPMTRTHKLGCTFFRHLSRF